MLVPVFMALFFSDFVYGRYFAALVFGIAALTDTFDGYLARLRKETTNFGEIIDPFADKLLITAALVSLVQAGRLSSWFVVVILSREFLVSALRALVLSKGLKLPVSKLGKTKTFFQIVAILLCVSLDEKMLSLDTLTGKTVWLFLAIALVLTIYSAIDYFRSTIMLVSQQE